MYQQMQGSCTITCRPVPEMHTLGEMIAAHSSSRSRKLSSLWLVGLWQGVPHPLQFTVC